MKNSRFIVRLTFRWCPKPNLTQLPGNLFFYLYPLRFDNRRYYNGTNQSVGRLENVADAEDICRNIGDGWRLPTASELLLSFVYENAFGW